MTQQLLPVARQPTLKPQLVYRDLSAGYRECNLVAGMAWAEKAESE
jgi:hypothetical protein